MTEPRTDAEPARAPAPGEAIHVFLGTKAQYIKTAPLLRLLDERGVPYRLIDSGQHGALSVGLRAELGVRQPDLLLGGGVDVTTIPAAAAWAARIGLRLLSRAKVRAEVFGGLGGVCVVHGDTPSTLLATLLARRAGLRVAHLEAGLSSGRLWHPFPEEAIRRVVMRLAHVLFAPDAEAVANLGRWGLADRVVPLGANTSVESLAWAAHAGVGADGPVVVTCHRVENLNHRARLATLVDLAVRLAAERPVRWVVHGPTREKLRSRGLEARLVDAGVELVDLLPHREFAALLASAPFVLTDGGSIQEECALLGVPCLLWRGATERPDGVGRNVVLGGYDPAVAEEFLADPERWRHPPATGGATPSARILEVLLADGAPPA